MTKGFQECIVHYLQEAEAVPARMRAASPSPVETLKPLEPIAFACGVQSRSRHPAEDWKLVAFQKALEKQMWVAEVGILRTAAAIMRSYICAAIKLLRAAVVSEFYTLNAKAYEFQISDAEDFCQACQNSIDAILDISHDRTPLYKVIDINYIQKYIRLIRLSTEDAKAQRDYNLYFVSPINTVILCCVPKESQHLLLCDDIWT